MDCHTSANGERQSTFPQFKAVLMGAVEQLVHMSGAELCEVWSLWQDLTSVVRSHCCPSPHGEQARGRGRGRGRGRPRKIPVQNVLGPAGHSLLQPGHSILASREAGRGSRVTELTPDSAHQAATLSLGDSFVVVSQDGMGVEQAASQVITVVSQGSSVATVAGSETAGPVTLMASQETGDVGSFPVGLEPAEEGMAGMVVVMEGGQPHTQMQSAHSLLQFHSYSSQDAVAGMEPMQGQQDVKPFDSAVEPSVGHKVEYMAGEHTVVYSDALQSSESGLLEQGVVLASSLPTTDNSELSGRVQVILNTLEAGNITCMAADDDNDNTLGDETVYEEEVADADVENLPLLSGPRQRRSGRRPKGPADRNLYVFEQERGVVEEGDSEGDGSQAKKASRDVTCHICGVTLKYATSMVAHLRKHTGVRPFKCPECGKGFTTKANMLRHRQTHTGDKPFECQECHKCFTEKKSLHVHMRCHTGEKPFCCKECGQRFTQSGTLKSHMDIHLGKKGHLCELCGNSFRQMTQLRQHMKRHLQQKAFKCDQCNMSFYSRADMSRHHVRHTGERPYQCGQCQKTFTRAQYLREHMNTHMGRRPYKCAQCGEAFALASPYYRHLGQHRAEATAKAKAAGQPAMTTRSAGRAARIAVSQAQQTSDGQDGQRSGEMDVQMVMQTDEQVDGQISDQMDGQVGGQMEERMEGEMEGQMEGQQAEQVAYIIKTDGEDSKFHALMTAANSSGLLMPGCQEGPKGEGEGGEVVHILVDTASTDPASSVAQQILSSLDPAALDLLASAANLTASCEVPTSVPPSTSTASQQ